MHQTFILLENIGNIVPNLLQTILDDGLRDTSCARAQTLQYVETIRLKSKKGNYEREGTVR